MTVPLVPIYDSNYKIRVFANDPLLFSVFFMFLIVTRRFRLFGDSFPSL